MNQFYKFIVLSIFVSAGMIFGMASETSALSSWFPDSDNNPDNKLLTAMVSDADGSNVLLDAERARFRVFIDPSRTSPVDIIIHNACERDTAYNDVMNSDISATIPGYTSTARTNSSNCSGSDIVFNNVPVSEFKLGPMGPNGLRIYGEYKSVVVQVNKTGGVGIKSFKINTPGAYVTFDEDLPLPNASARDKSFSVWNASKSDASNSEASYQFKFRPSQCVYNGTDNVWINWHDADYGETNEQGNNINIRVHKGSASGPVIKKRDGLAEMGNNDTYKDSNLNKLEMDQLYTWRWNNVDKINGVQIFMPYSEITVIANCDPPDPPEPAANSSCSRVTINMPNDGVTRRFRVYVNDWGSAGTPVDTNGDGDAYNDNVDYGGTAVDSTVAINLENSTATNTASFSVNGRADKVVSGTLTTTVVVYSGSTVSTGILSQQTFNNSPCYTATCSISITGNVPEGGTNDAQANRSFGVTVRITNTGKNTLPSNINGYSLAGTMAVDGKWSPAPDGDWWDAVAPNPPDDYGTALAPARINSAIAPGYSKTRSFDLTAPNDIDSHTLRMYPDYWGRGGIGAGCPTTVNTYKEYNFASSVSTELRPDSESPAQAVYTSSLTQQGTDVNSTATRSFFKERSGVRTGLPGFGPALDPGNFGNRNYSDTYNIPIGSYQLGDVYCMLISLARGHGWRGPGNTYVNNTPQESTNCATLGGPPDNIVSNRPYVRTYGADVVAGGGFLGANSNCGATTSGIFAFMRPLNEQTSGGNRSGSGAQLATMALGNTSGFTSASIRNDAPASTSGNGMTFAHGAGAPSFTSIDAVLGSGMSAGNGWCAPDYYADTQFPDSDPRKSISTSSGALNLNSLNDNPGSSSYAGGKQTRRDISNGKMRIIGMNDFRIRHTVYVDGDVFIMGDIRYITSYPSISAIPNFTLIVKGNIYIDKDIRQLDGLYIAQPRDDDTKGRIYTCAREGGSVADSAVTDPSEVFAHCGGDGADRRLVVNGALIANRLIFNRASYTLRDSRYQEGPYMTNPSFAAEVINFSPELFLAPSVFRPTGTQTSGDYDYISTLPPIL